MDNTWREIALAACRLLGDAANGRNTADDLPHETPLLGFAKAHRLETLISSALRIGGADEHRYRSLHEAADIVAFHQTKNDLLTADILRALQEHGVDAFPLKGIALQAVYPIGWVRTSTDTDLYIPEKQLNAASAVLADAGFTQTQSHDGDQTFQKPPRSIIELHTSLGGYTDKQRQILCQLAATPFSINEHYVYTLFHLYKHFLYAGAGVRMFLDIYFLSRTVTDRDAVTRWLDKLGILPFEQAVCTVNGILFDGNEATEPMAEVIDLVMKSGTFGTSATYHAMQHATHTVTRRSRLRTWISDHGFDRDAMTARYPVLARHRLLYPVCVIRRIVHGFIFKRTILKNTVKTETAVDRRQIHRVLKTMHIL